MHMIVTLVILYSNLEGNPLRCNCHMGWLAEWLRTLRTTSGVPKCQSPPHLQDVLITEVPSSQFACEGNIPTVEQYILACKVMMHPPVRQKCIFCDITYVL